jgi:hypothetical protein
MIEPTSHRGARLGLCRPCAGVEQFGGGCHQILSCPFLHSIPCQKAVLSVELKPWTQFMNSSTVAPLSATAKISLPRPSQEKTRWSGSYCHEPSFPASRVDCKRSLLARNAPLPARVRLQGASGRCDRAVSCQRPKQEGVRHISWVFNVERPAWLRHEESGRSSAEHGATNPPTSVVIAIAGKNVMNWAPTTYGSTTSRSTVATPADAQARGVRADSSRPQCGNIDIN